jgi:hypothetical protein
MIDLAGNDDYSGHLTDNGISQLMGSNVSRMISPKLLFHSLCTLKLICLLSFSYWNQFISVPKW